MPGISCCKQPATTEHVAILHHGHDQLHAHALDLDLDPGLDHPFRCPISLEVMRDPVTLSTGQTYERGAIRRWLAAGNSTCPITRKPLAPLITADYCNSTGSYDQCNDHASSSSLHLTESAASSSHPCDDSSVLDFLILPNQSLLRTNRTSWETSDLS